MRTAAIFIGLMVSVVIPVNAGFKQDLPKYIATCTKEGKMNQDIMKRILTLREFTAPDVACALQCMAQQAGMINSEGTINLDMVVAEIIASGQVIDQQIGRVREVMDACMEQAAREPIDTPCGAAAFLARCLSELFVPPVGR